MKMLCSCNTFDCNKTVEIPFEEAQNILIKLDAFIIIDECCMGANPTDILIEKKDGYSIYRDLK